MTFWLVLLAGILMWTMWICAFMHQMYPLTRPTVPAPVYKVKCSNDTMCLYVGADACGKLDDYKFDGTICTPNAKALF
jgi:ATP synthase subunit H